MTALSFLEVIEDPSFLDFQTPVIVSTITETPIRIRMPLIGIKNEEIIPSSCIE